MTYAAISRTMLVRFDRHRSQIIAALFGLLLICIGLLLFYLNGRYAFPWADTDFKEQEFDHAQLVVAHYSVTLVMLAVYLLTIGGLYLFTQRSLSLLNFMLVFIGACATAWVAQRYMTSWPEIMPLPLVLVFWLIARSDTPGCLILLTMAGATLVIYGLILVGLRLDFPTVGVFHYEGQVHYLFVKNNADFDFDRDLISAYSCADSTCKLVYPCGSYQEQVCLEKETIREAWARE